MYRVQLTDAQRDELQRRAHAPRVMPRTRDRLEMVRLSDAGFSIPQIARHLRISEKRVRHYIKAFLSEGFDALPDRPHPGQPSALTPAMVAALREALRQGERTWTAPQIPAWVEEQFGVRLDADWLGKQLQRARIRGRRNANEVLSLALNCRNRVA
jgi:transposase